MWMKAVHRVFTGVMLTASMSVGAGNVAAQAVTDPNQIYDPALFAELDYRMVGPSRGG